MIATIELLNYGICQLEKESAEIDQDSPTGYFLGSEDISFTDQTDEIRIKNGLAFGIEYLLRGTEEENAEVFEVCITHPPMVKPTSTLPITEVTESKVGAIDETNFDYYKFEYSWESQPGEWLFEVRQQDRLLLKKWFNVCV